MNRYDYYCTSCVNAGKDGEAKDDEVCWSCIAMGGIGNYRERKTNYDLLISKTPEEMAKTCSDYVSCHNCPIPYCKHRFTMEKIGCQENWLDWLKQEAVQDA